MTQATGTASNTTDLTAARAVAATADTAGTADGTQGADDDRAVLVEQRAAGLWLRLNRPRALNGITPATVTGLHAGLDRAERDDSVRAVVLAAVGRVFCAGADLTLVHQMASAPQAQAAALQQSFLQDVGDVLNRLEAFGKPVVAAVHGLAVAGGLELVLCCDLVIAAASARFGDAHANYGLLPGGGASVRLPRRVGPSRAKHLMFTGLDLPAADFLGTDLVTAVVPDADLTDSVDELVARMATKSPTGLARMKDLVDRGLQAPAEHGLRAELDAVAQHARTEDFAEGLRAFADKRQPRFTGR